MSNDRLDVKVVPNQNSVELTKSENKVVVTDKKQDTAVNVTQKETAVVTIISKGPKGDKGDTGDIGTTITNQIATGSITASVNIGADTFKVQSGSSTFFTINSSSNAGLGSNITIPTGEFGLSIYNTTFTPHTLIVGTDSADSATAPHPISSSVVIGGTNAHLDLYNPTNAVAANELIGAIRFRNNDTPNYSVTKAQIAAYATDTTPDGYLVFSTQQNPYALAERMRITNTGLVGIGTTTPTNTLEVNGGITSTSITASIISASSGITGSLFGTASVAVNAQTASFLPIGTYSITSSWATNAQTASNIFPAITNNTNNNVLTATGGGTINGESSLTFNGSDLTVAGIVDASIVNTVTLTVNGYVNTNLSPNENTFNKTLGESNRTWNQVHVGTSDGSKTAFFGDDLLNNPGKLFIRTDDDLEIRAQQGLLLNGSVNAPSLSNNTLTNTGTITTPSLTSTNLANTNSASFGGSFTPTARVHISGANANSLLRVGSPTNANILFVSGSGNVGIGTSTPQSQLHITGANALFTLSPINPLPTTGVASASFATSGSGADLKPYFWDGATWNALY